MPSGNICQSKSTSSGNQDENINAYLNFKIQVLLEGVETLQKTLKIDTELQKRPIPIQDTDVEMRNEVLKKILDQLDVLMRN